MADLTVTATSVLLTSGEVGRLNAGEAITAGQALYASSATAVSKAQCDGTAAQATLVGIALHAAGTGQPVTYAKHAAVINIGATTSKGATYFVSDTAGGICPEADVDTAGWYFSRLGYATAADGSFVIDINNTGVTHA